METVYQIDRNLELSKRRLENDNVIPEEAKKAILDFVDNLALEGISKHRQYFYIERLKIVAKIMGDSFINPKKEDIKSAILKLQNGAGTKTERYSERTISDIEMSIKKFYKDFENGKYYVSVEWLRMINHLSKEKKPDDIVSIEELNSLLEACYNERDRALISLLYDSGCRIGEILTLRVKDVEFDEYGIKLMVKGKTGVRRVRVVGDAVSLMREYIARFHRSNPDSFLFIKIGRDEPMTYADVNTIFYKISRRAGIKRRINPHLFRHTRATLLAKDLKEAPLEATMGWVHGSRMSRVYVHLSDEDVDNAVLKVYGITKKTNEKGIQYTPKICHRCKAENPTINEYCYRCGLPLDENRLIELEKRRDEAETAILQSSLIEESTKEILKNFDPEFKDKILEAILTKVVENVDLKEKFQRELATRNAQNKF